jgi:hypothetical protein
MKGNYSSLDGYWCRDGQEPKNARNKKKPSTDEWDYSLSEKKVDHSGVGYSACVLIKDGSITGDGQTLKIKKMQDTPPDASKEDEGVKYDYLTGYLDGASKDAELFVYFPRDVIGSGLTSSSPRVQNKSKATLMFQSTSQNEATQNEEDIYYFKVSDIQ